MLIRVIDLKQPKDLLGKAIKVFLKDGGKFNFKVTSCGNTFLNGYDNEGLEMHIFAGDIDYIVGG